MDDKEVALYFYRKVIYALYLEIGALQPKIHPELAEKANLNTAYFEREKERQAADLYHQIEHEEDPNKIVEPFEERTGLSLADLHRAFTEGDWRNKFGSYSFGGPRWAEIAEVALRLRSLIEMKAWQETVPLIYEIKGLKSNQGYLISQFERTERRKR